MLMAIYLCDEVTETHIEKIHGKLRIVVCSGKRGMGLEISTVIHCVLFLKKKHVSNKYVFVKPRWWVYGYLCNSSILLNFCTAKFSKKYQNIG